MSVKDEKDEVGSMPSIPDSEEEAAAAAMNDTTGSLSDSKRLGEVSHSPLKPSAARKRFEESCNEEDRPVMIERKSSKGPIAPKPKNGKYTYDDLKLPGSKLTKDHIDITIRESYLGDAEFEEVLSCTRKEFDALPKWKRESKKKAVGLF
eukprot:TRINITY_DN7237_c1_g2_i1.p1 TRINITY_DN7237_c1_g2~~TRINITY_DN7237_c1_g2_i1.p1  ORF type:complete len:150 (+),score=53.06 TRINITY_DN7237_c1_g2_i1:223-672(+)